MTEQEKIDQAAKTYGKNRWAFEHEMPGMGGLLKRLKVDASSTDFKAGITFFKNELLKGYIKEFGTWLWQNYRQVDAQVWVDRWSQQTSVFTIRQLVDKYFEQLKQKQDAGVI